MSRLPPDWSLPSGAVYWVTPPGGRHRSGSESSPIFWWRSSACYSAAIAVAACSAGPGITIPIPETASSPASRYPGWSSPTSGGFASALVTAVPTSTAPQSQRHAVRPR
jgi:hypothetical protein